MPRVRRIMQPGVFQHVMNRSNRRTTMFRHPADYEAFIDILIEAGRRFRVQVLAFCLMPNHWHLVLVGLEEGSISLYMRWLTGTHVRRYHRLYSLDGTGHLYQGRYTSVLVQGDVHLLIAIRYVEANPLRAGLVQRAEDWRWSSLGAPDSVRSQIIVDGPVTLPEDWAALVNAQLPDLHEFRQCIARGRPFGTPAWTADTASRFGLEFTMRPPGRPRSPSPESLALGASGSFC